MSEEETAQSVQRGIQGESGSGDAGREDDVTRLPQGVRGSPGILDLGSGRKEIRARAASFIVAWPLASAGNRKPKMELD